MPSCRLEERVNDWRENSQIDASGNVVRRIVLSGLESRNGYRYSESALRSAAGLYENKPVFLDHAERPRDGQGRSTRDLVGSIVNVAYSDGRIRGDVRVLETESGRTFLALAAGNTPGVGMSHVVLAERSVDGATVELIRDVLSVDVVVQPATTRTFRESTGQATLEAATEKGDVTDDRGSVAATGMAPSTLNQFDDLLKRWERMLARLEAAFPQGSVSGAGISVREGTGRSREAPSIPTGGAMGADDAGTAQWIEEADLSTLAMTSVFRRALTAAHDDSDRRELIEDRRALLESAGRGRVRSAQRVEPSGLPERTAFIRAVRGS